MAKLGGNGLNSFIDFGIVTTFDVEKYMQGSKAVNRNG